MIPTSWIVGFLAVVVFVLGGVVVSYSLLLATLFVLVGCFSVYVANFLVRKEMRERKALEQGHWNAHERRKNGGANLASRYRNGVRPNNGRTTTQIGRF